MPGIEYGHTLSPTYTTQVAVKPPDAVATVIVVFPTDHAFTRPFETVATPGADDNQCTFRSSAPAGITVAVSVKESPGRIAADVRSNFTPLTSYGTVITQSALHSPSTVMTLTVAVPPPTADTVPSSDTAATPGALENHAMSVSSPGARWTDGVS